MKSRSARLDAVVSLRKRELDTVRRTLATALGHAIRLSDQRDRLVAEAREAAEDLSVRLGRGVTAFEARSTAGAVDHVRDRASAAATQLVDCERSVVAARQQVTAAKTRVRALEIVQERRKEAERSRAARASQLELDEVGTRTALAREER